MKKEYEVEITIILDTALVELLEIFQFKSGDDHSRKSWFENLVKENFKEIMESENCYIDEPYAGFDAFPKTVHYFIHWEEESPKFLDDLVIKTGMSHSVILRWLVIRELRKYEEILRKRKQPGIS